MRRQINDGVLLYDSVTVKKTFENINRQDIIDSLIKTMIKANHENSSYIKETLIAIGSEENSFRPLPDNLAPNPPDQADVA